MASGALEQSALEAKDRDQLLAIAKALGVKSAGRAKKEEIIDMILEQTPDRVRAVKQVTLAEEYLQDHFPTFQVLPGVFMLEALVQAGRALLEQRGHPRMVLGSAKAMRYGSFVRPGEALEVDVQLEKELPDGSFLFKGVGIVRRHRVDETVAVEPETAVSGRFTLRLLRMPPQTPSQG